MTISHEIWSIPTSTGQTLGERVFKTSPTIKVIKGDNLIAFVKIWNERLQDAVANSDRQMEGKARSLLNFVKDSPVGDFALLLWAEYKLVAIYDNKSERIFLID